MNIEFFQIVVANNFWIIVSTLLVAFLLLLILLHLLGYDVKKFFFRLLGIVCVGMAYIGLVVPGVPFSIFLVIAAWAFAKSSPRLHDWLYNHPWFGPFLTNWTQKKVFPTKGKYAMIIVMSSSLAFLWFSTGNLKAVLWSGGFMLLVAVWAWRYPGSVEEQKRRIAAGEKVAWLK